MFLGREVQDEELPNMNFRNKMYSFKRILKHNFMETLNSLQMEKKPPQNQNTKINQKKEEKNKRRGGGDQTTMLSRLMAGNTHLLTIS